MSDIPCMHFVDLNCYEVGHAEEFMSFSFPKRFSENTQLYFCCQIQRA